MDALTVIEYNSQSPRSQQPPNVDLVLTPHQLAALEAMKTIDTKMKIKQNVDRVLECHSNLGIYADPPGIGGKTIVTLALIQELSKNFRGQRHKSTLTATGFSYNHYTSWVKCTSEELFTTTTSLIVVPDNVFDHWADHLRFTRLKYFMVDSTKKKSNISGALAPRVGNFSEYDVVLCKGSHYNHFSSLVTEVWNRVVFDEIDTIGITKIQYPASRFMWFISATYESMKYSRTSGFLKDLISLRHFWKVIKPFVVRGELAFVEESFHLDRPTVTYVNCRTPSHIRALMHNISPSTLHHLNAGNVEDAIVSLGGTLESNDSVIDLVKREIENRIQVIKAEMLKLEESELDVASKAMKLEFGEDRLRVLDLKMRQFDEHLAKVLDENDCELCADILESPTLLVCCQHIYCGRCVATHIKSKDDSKGARTCPHCRGVIKEGGIKVVVRASAPARRTAVENVGDVAQGGGSASTTTATAANDHRDSLPSKINAMRNIILQAPPNSKIIVSALDLNGLVKIMPALTELMLSSPISEQDSVVDGDTTTVTTTIRRRGAGAPSWKSISTGNVKQNLEWFNELAVEPTTIKILLVNSRTNGAGIDISSATDIILFHEMPKDIQTQIIGRTHRPGRVGGVKIWKLKYSHEYNNAVGSPTAV
jgi:hypothetical protein